MFKRQMVFAAAALTLTAILADTAGAQEPQTQSVSFSTRNLSGPRLGFTVVPGNTALGQKLDENNISRIMSQFGWHFEKRVVANADGPAFVIEFLPLVGAVEYGKPIVSLNLAFGIRLPDGYEFGVGPNLLFGKEVYSGLLIAAGKTLDVSGVSIPLNLAWVTSPGGARVAFMVGYAI